MHLSKQQGKIKQNTISPLLGLILMLTNRNWGKMREWGELWSTQAIILCLCNCVSVQLYACGHSSCHSPFCFLSL